MNAPQSPGHQPPIPLPEVPWLQPETLELTRKLLDSHRLAFGRSLLAGGDERLSDRQAAQELFTAAWVVLAHDGNADPRLTYANRSALRLWRRPWCALVGMPSRLTAEPERRADRRTMLQRALDVGAIEGYSGVRIDSQGRRFMIQRARLWTLRDRDGRPCGQAATFSDWFWLH